MASIDVVFLELKCTSLLLWPSSHPADIKVGSRKSEIRSRKSEILSRKSEVRSPKFEVRSRKSEIRGRKEGKLSDNRDTELGLRQT